MTKAFNTRKYGRKLRKAQWDEGFESVDLAARPQCSVLRPNKAASLYTISGKYVAIII